MIWNMESAYEKECVIEAGIMTELGDKSSTQEEDDANAFETAIENNDRHSNHLLYTVNEVPPITQCILLGFQHFITMMSGTALMPMIFYNAICVNNFAQRAIITSSTFFVMGICTLLQAVVGIRLPIIQGSSAAFVAPMFTILSSTSLPACSTPSQSSNITSNNHTNESTTAVSRWPSDLSEEDIWNIRISYVGGTLAVASVFQMLIGITGITSLIMRYVGPVVVAPTICLIGMALIQPAVNSASKHWYIAFMATFILIICSYLLDRFNVPCLTIKNKRPKITKFPLFKSFPVLIAILLSWGVCAILTVTNVLPKESNKWGHAARTDVRAQAIVDSPWFYFPYPGQFGIPRFAVTGILGMIAGVCISVIESIGDYLAAARLSEAPVPPNYAMNRGIFVEGFGCMLAGLFGVPAGSTSYSENVGAIAITRVGCRRVVAFSSAFMIILGLCPKLASFFISLPDPVVGGMFFAMFAMVSGVGLSNLQFVNLNLPRNIFIVGFAIFLGTAVPFWVKTYKPEVEILKGLSNEALKVLVETVFSLMSTELVLGGVSAFILDNTIPGSRKDRGLDWNKLNTVNDSKMEGQRQQLETYDIPYIRRCLVPQRLSKYVPMCPVYDPQDMNENGQTERIA